MPFSPVSHFITNPILFFVCHFTSLLYFFCYIFIGLANPSLPHNLPSPMFHQKGMLLLCFYLFLLPTFSPVSHSIAKCYFCFSPSLAPVSCVFLFFLLYFHWFGPVLPYQIIAVLPSFLFWSIHSCSGPILPDCFSLLLSFYWLSSHCLILRPNLHNYCTIT